jgi:hypothetical protein
MPRFTVILEMLNADILKESQPEMNENILNQPIDLSCRKMNCLSLLFQAMGRCQDFRRGNDGSSAKHSSLSVNPQTRLEYENSTTSNP